MVILRTAILFFILFITSSQFAQTVIPGGNVSGDWEADGNPYLVQGDITVSAEDRLSVKAGVEVQFTGNYTFEIYGRLDVSGTEAERVLFTLDDTTGFMNGNTGWGGLAFLGFYSQSAENSTLDHCIVEYSDGNGITCLDYPNLLISDAEVRYNRLKGVVLYEFSDINVQGIHIHHNGTGGMEAQFSGLQMAGFTVEHNNGTGIGLYGSTYSADGVLLTDGTVSHNHTTGTGGGLSILMDAAVTIHGVTIQNNSALLGGGVYSSWATAWMEGVRITGNQAQHGGGIYSDTGSGLQLAFCLLATNTAWEDGGGLWMLDSQLDMMRTTISSNEAGNAGGAIFHQLWYGDPGNISSSILWGNSPEEVHSNADGPEITWSDVAGGYPGEGNLDANPLFESAENGNYALSWTDYPNPNASRSPCIDAGDPGIAWDDDGTVADMGAYSFLQETVSGADGPGAIDLRCWPNPASGVFRIEAGRNMEKVSVFTTTGMLVMEQAVNGPGAVLKTGRFEKGMYLIRIATADGEMTTVKMIRE